MRRHPLYRSANFQTLSHLWLNLQPEQPHQRLSKSLGRSKSVCVCVCVCMMHMRMYVLLHVFKFIMVVQGLEDETRND